MWVSDKGGEGRDMEEGGWIAVSILFFFFSVHTGRLNIFLKFLI